MSAWLQHHALSLAETVKRLARSPLSTTLNVIAIGVALALPFGVYCVLNNLEALSRRVSMDPQISVFLDTEAEEREIASVKSALTRADGVRSVSFISRDAALAELGRTAGMKEVIASLPRNPLPDAFVVRLTGSDAALSERLEAEFKALPRVAHVEADSAWVRRLDAMLRVGRTGSVLLSIVLGLALVAVTFNTIRLQIMTHNEEIELCRLVGATTAYVRRPFFYLGAILGLLGGLVALAMVLGAIAVLNRDLVELSFLYGSSFRLQFPDARDLLAGLGTAIALGWSGAYLSVSRHLRATR